MKNRITKEDIGDLFQTEGSLGYWLQTQDEDFDPDILHLALETYVSFSRDESLHHKLKFVNLLSEMGYLETQNL